MTVTDAEKLIKTAFNKDKCIERWADLGCGTGLFTLALANQLAPDSKLFAVDSAVSELIPVDGIEISFVRANFETESLPFSNLDGILMANALHFVQDKPALIDTLQQYLNRDGRFIIVEYESERPNPWVPYPISFKRLQQLFSGAGFTRINKLGERKSIYGPRMMYSCLIEK